MWHLSMLDLEGVGSVEKAEITLDLLKQRPKADTRTFTRRMVDSEKSFRRVCYQMAKANSQINGTPLTAKNVEQMSVYEFYTLKSLLGGDKNPVENGRN